MISIKKLFVGCAVCTCSVAGFAAPAFAGEITGQKVPEVTPIKGYIAASICSFSGQDADDSLTGIDPDGDDAFFGRTQSFGQLVSFFGSDVARGAGAGQACKPGGGGEPA